MMEAPESWERYEQGLLKAASCCRELAKMLDAQEWRDLASQLALMLKQGRAIYNAAPLTEMEVLNLVTNMELAQKLAQHSAVH